MAYHLYRYPTNTKNYKFVFDARIKQIKKHIANPYKENFCKSYSTTVQYNNLLTAKRHYYFYFMSEIFYGENIPLGAFSASANYKQIRRNLFKGRSLPTTVLFEVNSIKKLMAETLMFGWPYSPCSSGTLITIFFLDTL